MKSIHLSFMVILAFLILIASACSTGKQNPMEPSGDYGLDTSSNPDNLIPGHNFLGAYVMDFDPETLETWVYPDRQNTVHANITGYLFRSPCPPVGCFTWKILSWQAGILTIELKMANPSALSPYDVRQIFTVMNNKKILDPDGYTELFDPPSTPDLINPFMAYAKAKANRRFPAGPWSIITEQMQIQLEPGWIPPVTYIIECSFGENTKEPYLIDNPRQYGVLPNEGGTTVVLADLYDWQDDVTSATIDTFPLNGRITNFSLVPETKSWRAFVNNYKQAPIGTYPCLIKAESPNPDNINMYKYVDVTVSEAPFSDNMPVSDCLDCDATTENIGQRGIATWGSDIWIVYSDNRAGLGQYHTRLQMSDSMGSSFMPSVQVSDTYSIMNTQPCIAQKDENVYVTWTWTNGINYDVKFAKSIDGGLTFGPETRPHPDPYSSVQANSHITVDGNGVIYIVYENDNFGYGIDIALITSSDGGNTWSIPVKVNDDTTDRGQFSPSIAADLLGNAAIVWEDKRSIISGFTHGDIYFTTTSDLGAHFVPNIKINGTNGCGAIDPAPAISLYLTGGAYVAWASESLGDSNIFFDYSPDRTAFGVDIRVNDDPGNVADQYDPSININIIGSVFIAWTDERNGNPDVYFTENLGGTGFMPNTIINTDTTLFNQFAPSITSDFLGRAYIIWSDARNTRSNENQEVFFAFRR